GSPGTAPRPLPRSARPVLLRWLPSLPLARSVPAAPEIRVKPGKGTGRLLPSKVMDPAPDDVSELESRQEPRLVRALEMVAPGTAVREGIEHILHAHTGALICIGEADELSFLYSGGVKLEVDYAPPLLYQLAKMDGAIVLSEHATKIHWANVQLMPDPTIT